MSAVVSKTVGRNVLSGYAVFFVRTATAFFLTPFVLGSIGVSDYGLWLLVLSVTGYFSLFDFGFGQAIVRYVAMKQATEERKALNELVSTFLLVYGAIGLVIAVVTVILSLLFPALFSVAQDQVGMSRFALLITGLAAALNFPLSVFGGLLHGYQRYDLTRSIGLATTIVNTALTIAVLLWGYGLMGLVVVAAAMAVASGLAQFAAARKVDRELDIRLADFNTSRVREVMSYSIYFFIDSAAVRICHRSDQIVIGLLLSTRAVAIYGVNLRLVELARSLAGQLNHVLFPVLAGLHAISDREQLRNALIEGTKISVGLIVAIGVQLVVLGPPFLEMWVGPEFLAGYSALVVLVAVAVMAIGQDIAAKTLLVADRQKLVAGVSVLDTVTNVVLSVVLVQRIGILGAALGTAIPFAAVAVFEVAVACRKLEIPLSRFAWNAFGPAMLAAVPAALLLLGLREWSYPSTWPDIIWQGSLALVLNLAGFVVLCLSPDRRGSYLGRIQRQVGGLRIAQS